jgi:hypothetical protein
MYTYILAGFIAAPNQSHFPTSNGCGADGLKVTKQIKSAQIFL